MAGFFLCLLLVCRVCPAASAPAVPVGPENPFPATGIARIAYTADTLGDINPCTTCGNTPSGGLARRAALLRTLAAARDNPLILAGPNEFYSDRQSLAIAPLPDKAGGFAVALHAAFSHMPYAGIYCSPAAVHDMRARNLTPPPAAVPVTDQPVTRFFRAGRLAVACVFLPAGSAPGGGPSADQILAAQRAARDAAQRAACIIAVSPWGIRAESALASSFGGYFHIMLGGGEGIAIPGQPTGEAGFPGPLWVRSDRRGRSVSVLDIISLPAPGSPWLEGINFSSRLIPLDPGLPQDEAVLDMLRPVIPTGISSWP